MNPVFLQKLLKLIRLGLILFFIGVFCYLFYRDFVPSGKLIIKNDFKDKSMLISDLYPNARLRKVEQDKRGEYYQRVFIDPVYFKIHSSRIFQKAQITIKYKNENQELFQVGVKRGSEGWNFNIKPLEFQKIDNLDWQRVKSDSLILLQREKNYDNIVEFLSEPPKNKRVAFYNFGLEATNTEDYLFTTLNPKTDLDHVDYIIAKYISPEQKQGFKIAQAEFDLDESNLDQGKLEFIISAPEMDVKKNEIDIYELEVVLEKEPLGLIDDLKDYLRFTIKNIITSLR